MKQEQTFTIINRLGLHARAAAKFVTTASEFQADIQVSKDNRQVNGKSIMGVMMLAAAKGTEIQVTAEGEDAETALKAIGELIANYFGEGQ
ncbi:MULTISPECIES: HPr family phosphocarrier protein [unclassified Methylophaga]|jgi:phosphocarrier protein HPr|uniref:HPr family phosphocarrier protein n=1 Tax=unclassified Methylophaga TaxID=2629249 RepID=UPI000C0DFAA5|nr:MULTISPECIES: HPr family phosphocarrier protein [unclassified Methylophaga]MBL1456826.1 HPr family phosphocarrier protein [Methylophaga sp.]|tara:strand:- start:219 stop:491 length:273 start_codon:yes stop_codon:yes gene_type:complete